MWFFPVFLLGVGFHGFRSSKFMAFLCALSCLRIVEGSIKGPQNKRNKDIEGGKSSKCSKEPRKQRKPNMAVGQKPFGVVTALRFCRFGRLFGNSMGAMWSRTLCLEVTYNSCLAALARGNQWEDRFPVGCPVESFLKRFFLAKNYGLREVSLK